MQNNILVFLTVLLGVIGGTGAYKLSALFSNLMYITSLGIYFWIQLGNYRHMGPGSIKIDLKKYVVFLLYIAFLLAYFLKETTVGMQYMFTSDAGLMRQYTDLFRGLITFLIVAATYQITKEAKVLVILPLLCLGMQLLGLFLESYEIIDYNDKMAAEDYMDEDANTKLLHRPGGFLNANMTAAIAMIWFFIMMEVNKDSAIILKGLALLLTLSICILTQSRAAMLFLASYALYTLIVSRNVKFLMALVFVAMVSLTVSHYFELVMVQDIVDNFTSRADRNNSSTLERLSVLAYAIKSFFDAPVFGNGYRYVAKTEGHGLSSHNQVMEILTNFGLVGFVIIVILYITFYHKNSFSYLSLCIFPTMLFSHNFFENSSYQVVLAFAYYGYDKAQAKIRGNRIVKEME